MTHQVNTKVVYEVFGSYYNKLNLDGSEGAVRADELETIINV